MSSPSSQTSSNPPSGELATAAANDRSQAMEDRDTDVSEGAPEQTPASHTYLVRTLLGFMTAQWNEEELDSGFSNATRTIQKIADQWMLDKAALRTAPEPSNSIRFLREWRPMPSRYSEEMLRDGLLIKSALLDAVWFCLTGDPGELNTAARSNLELAHSDYNHLAKWSLAILQPQATLAAMHRVAACTGQPMPHWVTTWQVLSLGMLEGIPHWKNEPGPIESLAHFLADHAREASERLAPLRSQSSPTATFETGPTPSNASAEEATEEH